MNLNMLKTSVAVVLLASIAAGPLGCSDGTGTATGPGAESQTTTGATSQSLGYDGETIFRGIFLASGPVAAVLPELSDPTLAQEAQKITKEELANYLQNAADKMREESAASAGAKNFESMATDLRSGKLTPEQLVRSRREFQTTAADAIVARVRTTDSAFFDRFANEMQSGDQVRVQRAFEEGSRRFIDAASIENALPGHVVPEMKCLIVLVAVYWVAVYYESYWLATLPPNSSGLHHDEIVNKMASTLYKP